MCAADVRTATAALPNLTGTTIILENLSFFCILLVFSCHCSESTETFLKFPNAVPVPVCIKQYRYRISDPDPYMIRILDPEEGSGGINLHENPLLFCIKSYFRHDSSFKMLQKFDDRKAHLLSHNLPGSVFASAFVLKAESGSVCNQCESETLVVGDSSSTGTSIMSDQGNLSCLSLTYNRVVGIPILFCGAGAKVEKATKVASFFTGDGVATYIF
jgi:hypothetical protein